MAQRPVFVPVQQEGRFVDEVMVDFTWFAGMSVQQKRKSIAALHDAARKKGIHPVLEISTKSTTELGRALSAFNLKLALKDGRQISVEAAYQGGKVFDQGGPYLDLYALPGKQIKADPRLYNSGGLIAFEFQDQRWALEPKTAFYDWLYLNALTSNPELSAELLKYNGFTDIEFNPAKSINCQARAAALFVALHRQDRLDTALTNQQAFLETTGGIEFGSDYKQTTFLT